MTTQQVLLTAATLSLGLSLWLLLPRGKQPRRTLGIALGLLSLALFGAQLPLLATWISDALFGALAIIILSAAVVTITARNPLHSAAAFVVVLLGAIGLFLFLGAYLLALVTLLVYASLVGGLYWYFSLHTQAAENDHVSWKPLLAAAAGAVLVGMMTMMLTSATSEPERLVSWAAAPFTATEQAPSTTTNEHGLLQHAITFAVAGVLLLTAAAGAAAIFAQTPAAPVEPAAEPESEPRG